MLHRCDAPRQSRWGAASAINEYVERSLSSSLLLPTQDCLELGLDAKAVQSGHAVSYAALGISSADEAALTLLPAAAGWSADKLSEVRQVLALCILWRHWCAFGRLPVLRYLLDAAPSDSSAAGALQHIRGQLRAAQAARACTRHAGRVYGQPLVGPALAVQASGARVMPELRTVGEEARAAWLQASLPIHI